MGLGVSKTTKLLLLDSLLQENRKHRPHVSSVWRYYEATMSLKVSIGHGTRGVTVEKDRKREKKERRSRSERDLREVISKEMRGTGDLRDRLEEVRGAIREEELRAASRDKSQTCEMPIFNSESKMTVYSDEKSPDSKGKENSKEEIVKESKVIKEGKEKTLTSEWGQRKKKKKKRSKSSSKERKPLADKETENRKRKHSVEPEAKDGIKIKKEKRKRSTSRDEEEKKRKKEKKKEKKLQQSREQSGDVKLKKRSKSRDLKVKRSQSREAQHKRSKSREIKRRSYSREVRRRSPSREERRSSPLREERRSLPQREERRSSPRREERRSSPLREERRRSRSRGSSGRKESSGRKSRIDSGISTLTNGSKDSVSPRDVGSPRRDTSEGKVFSPRKLKQSPPKTRGRKVEEEDDRGETSLSPSPSPPRRILERQETPERRQHSLQEMEEIKKDLGMANGLEKDKIKSHSDEVFAENTSDMNNSTASPQKDNKDAVEEGSLSEKNKQSIETEGSQGELKEMASKERKKFRGQAKFQ